MDPIALLAHFEPQDQGDVDAAGDCAAELSKGLSFVARTGVISVHKGLIIACQALKLSTIDAPFKAKGLALTPGKSSMVCTNNLFA